MSGVAREYVIARRVLLDGLELLAEHRDSLVLIGAQAVYCHAGSADLRVPLATTDADLAINREVLADAPEISALLERGGFCAGRNPGHWIGAA